MNTSGMPGYYNNPHMMGGGYQPMGVTGQQGGHMGGGFNPQGQRMPYMNEMGGGRGGWAPGQRAPMGPGGPRGPFMGNMGPANMGNMAGGPMPHHQMMPRGARPMMPSGQGLPTGARPMMSNQGMYGGQPNQGMPMGQNWGPSGSAAPGYGSPQQYAQPPYHSPNMQTSMGQSSMGQRFPGPQGGPQRSIGNPKQALQDMLRARHTDPQFNTGPGNNFVPPPGRTTFQMRPSMSRMPQTTMYGSSAGGNPQGQYNTSGGPNPNSGNYGNFQNQGNQYPYR